MTSTQPARPTRRRVPRNTLNPDRILDAAVTLLDRDGPEAFTMRALAEQLGVGTMAVYSHFRGKDELTEAVTRRLLAEVELPATCGGSPREQLRELCRGVFRLLTEHPSVLRLLTSRPIEGDEAITLIDRMLGLLRGAGLARAEAARAQIALMQHVVGSAVWTAKSRRDEDSCPDTVPQKSRDRPAELSADRYPALHDLGGELLAARADLHRQYEYGLDALLDGLLRRA